MDLRDKLRILADSAKYDASCASSGAKRSGTKDGIGHSDGMGICHSYTPDGRCVSLLKILLTNYCIYDCLFCVNRATSDIPRARFLPKEVVELTLDFYKRNYIEGLFLSSGIIQSADYTMEQLIAVAKSLRVDYKFGGYIHLKAIPGASEVLVEEAGRWADRLSANIELPTDRDLRVLAPEKTTGTIESTMTQIHERVAESKQSRKVVEEGTVFGSVDDRTKRRRFAPAGQSTQMVVGATPSSDTEILATAKRLYDRHGLRRIYYSAFSPFPKGDSRLPLEAPPLVREHRLYQADWLMRYYGFDATELTSVQQPNLEIDKDPKLSWALRNREAFPVDVNSATREQLLRVPGIGYRNVDRILRIRKYHQLRLEDLAKLRVSLRKTQPFIITADHNPLTLTLDRADLSQRVVQPKVQLELFSAERSALFGEV